MMEYVAQTLRSCNFIRQNVVGIFESIIFMEEKLKFKKLNIESRGN